ncbi:hypothetical protein ACFOOM_10180 [Streptomyces echinoruber]|uniref:Head-to-tail stopper n=1 Tax=Streptomyces echinoruber TaxID=68898 RepID=A0A918S372_9ACTN|nr:hypothetical protein [Streptomyces echinoruber]GHA19411.1 hypothetical protein GCM10010389_66350 [Streptomyces echinoruber]
MRVPGYLLRHRVTVEPYDGDSAYGPTYRPPVEVRALVAEGTRLTRNREGVEVASTAQVITAPGLDCPPESRITLPSGRVTKAISTAQHTAPGLPVPACTEVMCE